MSNARTGGDEAASDLFDAWMAHRGRPGAAEETAEKVETADTTAVPPATPPPRDAEPLEAPEPVAPEPIPDGPTLTAPAVVPAVLPEPDSTAPAAGDSEPASPEGQLGISAALAAAAAQAEEQARQPQAKTAAPRPAPEPTPHVPEREPVFAAAVKPEPPPPPDDMPAVTEFAPRGGERAVAGALLLAALVAAGIAGYLAWYERSAATVGIGCTLFILVLVIWATRASSAPAHLEINSGHLTVERTGTIRHFDLASKYTALEVHGRPGLPGWKVLIEQRDAPPFVIDSAMVDPKAFMRVLRYYRPEL